MTSNQINYATLKEKERNDREVEKLRKAELEESKRATDLARDTNLKSIEAGVLNVQRQTEASKYSANQSAGASIYSANTQKEINTANISAQERLRESQAQLNTAQVYHTQAQTSLTKSETVETYVNTGTKIGKIIGGAIKVAKSIFG